MVPDTCLGGMTLGGYVSSPQACARRCDQYSSCVAYSFHYDGTHMGSCWLKPFSCETRYQEGNVRLFFEKNGKVKIINSS
jgi:L-ascorbate metabolism protein UlaG (beta-lactamase superfamily)